MASQVNPFDSIDGAQQYLELLVEAIQEARSEVEADLECADAAGRERAAEALRLVIYKLARLKEHIEAGQKLLGDLETLERLLTSEKTLSQTVGQS